MKRLLLAVALASATAVFGKDGKRSPQVDRVRDLYKAAAWEIVGFSDPGESLLDQPRGVLAESFEPTLADLLAREAECLRRRSVCRLLHHPLFTVRDPFVRGLEVVATDTVSSVVARFAEGGGGSERRTEIVFHLSGSGKNWRIENAFYPDGTNLREILSAPME